MRRKLSDSHGSTPRDASHRQIDASSHPRLWDVGSNQASLRQDCAAAPCPAAVHVLQHVPPCHLLAGA